MARMAGVVAAALLLFGTTACGDDDDADDTAEATTSTTEAAPPSTDEEDSPSSGDVTDEPVEGFTERAVTFANLTYTVTGAHVSNQDLRGYADGADPEPGDGTHLLLDVTVQNATGRQLESDADAIGLEVDGERTGLESDFLSDVTGFVGPDRTVDGFLAFAVDGAVDLGDAALVLGTTPDRAARLPLTGDLEPAPYPIELEVSGEAVGTGPTNGGTIRFELVGGTLFVDSPHGDTTSPTGERADEGEVFVQLHVRATKTDGRGNDVLAPADGFRLLVDGVARSPFDIATAPEGSTPTPTAEPGASVDAWVLFAVEADGDRYVLQVGASEAEPGRIELELPPRP